MGAAAVATVAGLLTVVEEEVTEVATLASSVLVIGSVRVAEGITSLRELSAFSAGLRSKVALA
jgi:hypothetical protein